MYALLLVSSESSTPVEEKHLRFIRELSGEDFAPRWIERGKAVECMLSDCPPEKRARLEHFLAPDRIDTFLLDPEAPRQKKLLICDMDSTIVDGETLDNLSASMGLKEQIAAITSRAMAGEMDFKEALRTRISMLEGMPEEAIAQELTELRFNDGAKELVQTMSAHGAICVLVSGGFTCFTEPVAKTLGFHFHHGNIMNFKDGKTDGTVGEPILNREAKIEFLHYYQKKYKLQKNEILAVGDGANDLEMINAAGLGIGYHPKQYLRERITNYILYGSLSSLLYLQK